MTACRSRDSGVSLPELIITMALLGLLTTIVMLLVTHLSSAFSHERSTNDNAMTASNGMNELTRVIRAGTGLRLTGASVDAPVFVSAAKNSVVLYAYIDAESTDPRPLKVQFSVDTAGRVRETRWLATTTETPWAFSPAAVSTRTIAHAVPAGASPLFRYFTATGGELTVPPAGTLTDADLKLVAAVRINLTVQTDPSGRVDPVELRNTVSIPNLGVSRIRP